MRQRILDTLRAYVRDDVAEAALDSAVARVRVDFHDLQPADWDCLLAAIDRSLRFHLPERDRRVACMQDLDGAYGWVESDCLRHPSRSAEIPIRSEADIIFARAAAREICAAVGLSPPARQAVLVVLTQLAQTLLPAKTGKVRVAPAMTGHPGIEVAVDGVPDEIARAIPPGMEGLMDVVGVAPLRAREARVRCVKCRAPLPPPPPAVSRSAPPG